MGDRSKIEWTQATWNPIVGCTIVSPGCTNCYAMQMAHRIKRMEEERTGRPDASHYFETTKVVNGHPVWTGTVKMAPDHIITAPLRWKRPRRIFVNSMSDLFHESVPDEWIDRVFAVMALCSQHQFQVLTKRSKRMLEYLTALSRNAERDRKNDLATVWQMRLTEAFAPGTLPITKDDVCRRLGRSAKFSYDPPTPTWPLPNVWLGVSCEDQQRADERIPDLLETPAAIRWVSAEPLLGFIDFVSVCTGHYFIDALDGVKYHDSPDPSPVEHCAKLDWIVAGGESGPSARPMHPDWARSIRNQCREAGVPFLFKQWGEWRPPLDHETYDISKGRAGNPPAFIQTLEGSVHCFYPSNRQNCSVQIRVGKKRAGRLLDGVAHDEYPR